MSFGENCRLQKASLIRSNVPSSVQLSKELAKLIEGNAKERIKKAGAGKKAETERVLEELSKAFDKVEKIKSKSGDTYGDLLKESKLPVHEGADE